MRSPSRVASGADAAALAHPGVRRALLARPRAPRRAICGNRCTCWWPSMKSGARPKASTKASATGAAISAAQRVAARSGAAWRGAASSPSGRNAPSLQRREARAQRPERRGQRHMQADRHARRAALSSVERDRFRAMKARRHHHHRGGVEAPAHDQIADRGVDRRRDAVVVGAQPDAARRLGIARHCYSAADRVGGRRAASALARGLDAVLGDEIDRPRFELGEDLADIFAHDPDHDQLHAAEHHQADHHRRIARHRLAVDERLDQDLHAEDERADRQQQPEQAREPQRRDRERGQSLDRQADQRVQVPVACGRARARPARSRRGSGGSRSSSRAP